MDQGNRIRGFGSGEADWASRRRMRIGAARGESRRMGGWIRNPSPAIDFAGSIHRARALSWRFRSPDPERRRQILPHEQLRDGQTFNAVSPQWHPPCIGPGPCRRRGCRGGGGWDLTRTREWTMSMDSLKDLYVEQLRDLYSAGNQILKASSE